MIMIIIIMKKESTEKFAFHENGLQLKKTQGSTLIQYMMFIIYTVN